MRPFATIAVLALLAGLLCSFGCGPGIHDRANVKGRVTFGGSAVPLAQVVFTTKDRRTGSALTDDHGNYEMRDAPVGEVMVSVTGMKLSAEMRMGKYKAPEPPKGMQPMAPPEGDAGIAKFDPKKIRPLPDKYEKPETSGLTYVVEKGEHKYDISLTP